MRVRLLLAICLVLIVLLGSSCAALPPTTPDFDRQFNSITQPYRFDIFRWEISALLDEVRQTPVRPENGTDGGSQSVVLYFSSMARLHQLQSEIQVVQAKNTPGGPAVYQAEMTAVEEQIGSLKNLAEKTLSRQITAVLAEQGIYNPFTDGWLRLHFPPVSFTLERPLYILVVSPRDRIDRMRDVIIKQNVTVAQMEAMESELERLNVSALVMEIGGLGATYPAFVINNSDLRWTIEVAIEEWLHQYLAFRPLGFRYLLDSLGLRHDTQIITINETVAGIASRELADLVYAKYYDRYTPAGKVQGESAAGSGFDFNKEMRRIRLVVDNYLAQDRIEQAERFMEEQRQYLAANGYYLRKLNQAYFAFHGSYADSPASVDPIGDEIKLLRKNSPSIKSFLEVASGITSREDLFNLVNRH